MTADYDIAAVATDSDTSAVIRDSDAVDIILNSAVGCRHTKHRAGVKEAVSESLSVAAVPNTEQVLRSRYPSRYRLPLSVAAIPSTEQVLRQAEFSFTPDSDTWLLHTHSDNGCFKPDPLLPT